MRKDEAMLEARNRLHSYLQARGINTKHSFTCLCQSHRDSTPSMNYKEINGTPRVYCFGCGFKGDIFDVVAEEYGLARNSKEAYSKTYDVLGISVEYEGKKDFYPTGRQIKQEDKTMAEAQKPIEEVAPVKPMVDYSGYIEDCAGRIDQTDYHRGISEETLKAFHVGYDEHAPLFRENGSKYGEWKALIIPTGKYSYVIRNTDSQAEKQNRYRKVGQAELFNASALKRRDINTIMVVEGEIDALSIIDVGAKHACTAVGLGSTSNVDKFIKAFKGAEVDKYVSIYLALDNDKSGREATEKLIEGLKGCNNRVEAIEAWENAKDPNELLMRDRDNLSLQVEKLARKVWGEYLRTSASFLARDIIQKTWKPQQVYKTGFSQLDKMLGGGLYTGLYTLGAISSLGKTTFCVQIADQVAQAGNDVLYFSLEMGADELIAKSISRLMYDNSVEKVGSGRLAKTTRGILSNRREFSKEEHEIFLKSARQYVDNANCRIYIHVGVGTIGVEQIKQEVEKHIRITRRKPLVIIDYVQILAPYDDKGRLTDKQSVDKNVLELKRMSRDFDIPIVGISSFNRASYGAPVDMSALKESGALEYGSDAVIGLQYAGMGYQEGDTKEKRPKRIKELLDNNATLAKQGKGIDVECVILKQRNGAKGTVPFKLIPMFNRYYEPFGAVVQDKTNPHLDSDNEFERKQAEIQKRMQTMTEGML